MADVHNDSPRNVRLRYCLHQKIVFVAKRSVEIKRKKIFEESGDSIAQSFNKTVTKVITIPEGLTMSILHSKVIGVEYKLKVKNHHQSNRTVFKYGGGRVKLWDWVGLLRSSIHTISLVK